MKAKLLRIVRKRYSITKYKAEPWMANDNSFFNQQIWEVRNADGFTYVFEDSKDGYGLRTNWLPSFEEAFEILLMRIRKDYTPKIKRRREKPKKVWYK